MSKGQSPPLTVRISDDLRARIDEAADSAGVSRNAWIVWALRRALGEAAAPLERQPLDVEGVPAAEVLGPKQVRVVTDRQRFWLVGAMGPVPGIQALTEDSVRRVARRKGFEVVD